MNAPSPSAWSERCRLLAPQIVDACAAVPASAGAVALSRDIRRRLPEWSFRETFCRGGWYRLGGIVFISGGRVADQLEQWATDSLAAHDGDLASLAAEYAESGLRATLISGRSHYFVAAVSGADSADFLQLEVEELQETYGLKSVSCYTCHSKKTDVPADKQEAFAENAKAFRNAFGKEFDKIMASGGYSAKIAVAKDSGDDAKKDAAEADAVTAFKAALKKVAQVKAPSGKTYDEELKAGTLDGVKK